MMKLRIKWKPGRQNCNYKVFNIFSSRILMSDCWLIKYPKYGFVSRHRDPAPGRRHWRLNIELKKPEGRFQCDGPVFKFWRFTLFRPDLYYHSFINFDKGSRLVLSFGISLPGKKSKYPKWTWIPLTTEEKLYGRTDYENQLPFVNTEMAERWRKERQESWDAYQDQISKLEF